MQDLKAGCRHRDAAIRRSEPVPARQSQDLRHQSIRCVRRGDWRAGADWLGFNFFPPSPRYVTPAQAADLSARARADRRASGLFVDPTPRGDRRDARVCALDILQLYGALDLPGFVRASGCRLARGRRRADARPARRDPTAPTGW